MTKHLYRIATSVQEQLLGAALLSPASEWPKQVSRVQLDAWATLWRWHAIGEPITRITPEAEDAMLDQPLPPDLPLATARTRSEALAVQLPDPREWIVIARHPGNATIIVQSQHCYGYAQPLLTYCASSARGSESGYTSGYINLIDQPTIGDVRLYAGTITDAFTERQQALTEAEITDDDYRLAIAIHALYSRQP